MRPDPISPELALVDPELGARARAALPDRIAAPPKAPAPVAAAPVAAPPSHEVHEGHARYPLWARVTAALWVLVIGILIGGAAIPHAQDRPRVVPAEEDAPSICERPVETPILPAGPLGGAP
jgi:hypothetical protein